MTGITDKNSGGTTLVSYGYTYDAAGLVTQETRNWDSGSDTDTLDYTYTNNDQLTGVTHTNDAFANESFSYDANGNETGTGFTTSTGNEQTASPGNTYTYDADGNMITDTNTSTGDTWTYSYNFAGQMTGAVEKNSDDTVIAQATYTYDALGNRIGMDENGTQTWTLYDGSDPIMDFNGSGSLEMRYLNGPTGDLVDSVIARESAGGTVAWYLPDRLGTIRDLINNSGSIIDHVDYSAFGTVLDESDPSNGDRMMGFAGMERDTVTGLNLAVNRVQNPGTGRWTSQDPLGFAAGTPNLSSYTSNEPIGAADPSGLMPGVQVTLPIRNPSHTIVLIGPPMKKTPKRPTDGHDPGTPEAHFCGPASDGGLGIPPGNVRYFNGLGSLAQQVQAILAMYPNGVPADLDIIIYVHGSPDLILVGQYPQQIVSLDGGDLKKYGGTGDDYRQFAKALLPVFKKQPDARLFLTGCNIASPGGEGTGKGLSCCET